MRTTGIVKLHLSINKDNYERAIDLLTKCMEFDTPDFLIRSSLEIFLIMRNHIKEEKLEFELGVNFPILKKQIELFKEIFEESNEYLMRSIQGFFECIQRSAIDQGYEMQEVYGS